MRRVIAIGLLVYLSSVVCEDDRIKADAIEPSDSKPESQAIIYWFQLLDTNAKTDENSEESNAIATDYVFPKHIPSSYSKLLAALQPPEAEGTGRVKRSPTHHKLKKHFGGGYGGYGGYGGGGGGGCCNACGGCGGGGGYPHYGGGGGGGSFSASYAQASAGSFSFGG